MPDFIVMALSLIVVLGIMVLVHEWGHFVVAKAFGVRVEVFSLGFGPRLWGRKKGDTDYRISALPLGGYVKMAGDNPLEERQGLPDEFLSKPRWQRVLIAIAGPAMNIITSIVLITGLNMHGNRVPAYFDKPMVLAGVLQDSTAQKAGLATGDHIVKVNSINNPTWERARIEFETTLPGHAVMLSVEGAGSPRSVSVTRGASLEDAFGYPTDHLTVGALTPGMPAERSGLLKGDQIVAVNGQSTNSAVFPEIVQHSEGQPLDLQVLRGASEQHVQVSAQRVNISAKGKSRWQIGVSVTGESTERKLSLVPAIGESVIYNGIMARQIVYVVAQLFRGNVSLKQLEGPLGIARESGRAAREGATEFLSLMAMIGMNLAILNLLPIPPLDGGHVLLLFIEGAMQRDLSMRVKERFITVSMVFLLLVFAVVMYNDVLRLIPHH